MGLRFLSSFVILAIAALSALGSPAAADEQSLTPGASKIVNLELKDTPIRDAIDSIFRDSGLKYYIRPGVSGKVVEMKLSGLTVEQAVKALVEAAELSLTIENGVYVISPGNRVTLTKSRSRRSTQSAEAQVAPPAEQSRSGASTETPNPAASPSAASGSRTEGEGSPGAAAQEPPAPVYYGWPGEGYYDPYLYGPYYDPYAYPPVYQYGNVQFLRGQPAIVIAGGNPPVLPRLPLMLPPPAYIGPEPIRFVPGPWPPPNRTRIIIPYYPYPY